jgi:hypothetical protein
LLGLFLKVNVSNYKLIQKGIIMKRKLLIFGTVFTFALVMPMFGQSAKESLANLSLNKRDTTDLSLNKRDSTELTATPTFEATTAGVHMKVWITATEGEIKDNDMSSAKATKAETVASSYHVTVELKNAESGKDVSDATASLMTVSPTNKDATLELKSMMNKFSGNLNFSEKGEYKLTLNIISGGATNATPFKYTVQ